MLEHNQHIQCTTITFIKAVQVYQLDITVKDKSTILLAESDSTNWNVCVYCPKLCWIM